MTFEQELALVFLKKYLGDNTMYDQDSSFKEIKNDALSMGELISHYTKFFIQSFVGDPSPKLEDSKNHLDFNS